MPKGRTNFEWRQLTRCVTQHLDRGLTDTDLKITPRALLSHVRLLDQGLAAFRNRAAGDRDSE